jgi:hypothetical protein
MKATRIIAAATLIGAGILALHTALAQQVGARRIDFERHDLSVPGREVIQTIVELEPGTTAPRHSHPGEEIISVLAGTTAVRRPRDEMCQLTRASAPGYMFGRCAGPSVITSRATEGLHRWNSLDRR